MVSVGDRPAPGAGPQDGPGVLVRPAGAGEAEAGGVGPFRAVRTVLPAEVGGDPHLWATTLFEEVRGLGYEGAYPSFTRALRKRGLRPSCEACEAAGTPSEFAVIDHPAGEETQWDWVELPDPPSSWGQGRQAHLLVGALLHSGAWRGVLAESEEQPYLVASLHGTCERLGGVTRRWRFDRMAAVYHPESGDLTASFAEVAKYYGAVVDVCPSRRGWRKGVAEKANHSAAQRWWRTLPDDVTPAQAQARLDAWCRRAGDARADHASSGWSCGEHLDRASWPGSCPVDPGQLPAVVPRGDLVRQPAGDDAVAGPDLGRPVLVGVWRTGCYRLRWHPAGHCLR